MDCSRPTLGPCPDCVRAEPLGFDFTMAYQPIVDLDARRIFAHEALVRGVDGAGAGAILSQVDEGNRYRFDQLCRVKAVRLAAKLGIDTRLSINFLPNAVYDPENCIRTTIAAAEAAGMPFENIVFEITEVEQVRDHDHLRRIFETYKRYGFGTAIDDFGAGYSGLGLLTEFHPDYLKLDMKLIRDIDTAPAKQAIVRGIVATALEMGIEVIAEGIEREGEIGFLRDQGIRLFQGYFFARPAFESLAAVRFA
ncbi:MAG: EAL domain-containing protein [Gammaproteobacteria bacterium]|nr:EAL domain-containing protein [Gammaproteobacteria bacterium]